MTLTITGIVYLDGCMPFVGTAIDESGMRLDVIFPDEQRIALLETIEATGEMVTSSHHGGRPAFAIASVQTVRQGTVGSLRRRLKPAAGAERRKRHGQSTGEGNKG